jgi:hypothetical protein
LGAREHGTSLQTKLRRMTQQATQQLARPSPPALLGFRCLLSREGVRIDRERAAGQERIDIWRTETEQSRAPIFFLFRVTLVDPCPRGSLCKNLALTMATRLPPKNAPPKRPQNRSRPARGARFTTGPSAHTPTPGRRRAGAIPWAAAAATRAWRRRRASNFTRASRARA